MNICRAHSSTSRSTPRSAVLAVVMAPPPRDWVVVVPEAESSMAVSFRTDTLDERFDQLRVAPQVLLPEIALAAGREHRQGVSHSAEPLLLVGSEFQLF